MEEVITALWRLVKMLDDRATPDEELRDEVRDCMVRNEILPKLRVAIEHERRL